MDDLYKCIKEYTHLEEDVAKIFIEDFKTENNEKICRFCFNTLGQTKFTKKAHTISANIGNKKLFSNDECDECNQAFGITFEDAFGKYIQPYKIVSEIFGRDPKIKYVNSSLNHRIQINKNTNIDKNIVSKGIIIDNESNKMVKIIDANTLEITLCRQPYRPNYVYLCFLKMALSIMPLEKYDRFLTYIIPCMLKILDKTKQKKSDDESEISKTFPNVGILEFMPGINPFNGVNVELLERKNNNVNHPSFILKLICGNFIFYIPVICDDEINGENKNIKFILDNKDSKNFEILDFKEEIKYFKYYLHVEKKIIEDSITIKKIEEALKNKKWIN